MQKVAVIYFNDLGSTVAMAEAVSDGIVYAGAEVEIFEVAEFIIDDINDYDGVAFGCPEYGDGELEEYEFEPLFSELTDALGDMPIVLFGSYSTGDGDWMENWEERCDDLELNLVASGVVAQDFPDDDVLEDCEILGEKLVEAI